MTLEDTFADSKKLSNVLVPCIIDGTLEKANNYIISDGIADYNQHTTTENIFNNSFAFLFYHDKFYECFIDEIEGVDLNKRNISEFKIGGFFKVNNSIIFKHKIFNHVKNIKLKKQNNNVEHMFCFLFLNNNFFSIKINSFTANLLHTDDHQCGVNKQIQLQAENCNFKGQIYSNEFLNPNDLKQIKIICQKQVIDNV